jgi:hypothetical protein
MAHYDADGAGAIHTIRIPAIRIPAIQHFEFCADLNDRFGDFDERISNLLECPVRAANDIV